MLEITEPAHQRKPKPLSPSHSSWDLHVTEEVAAGTGLLSPISHPCSNPQGAAWRGVPWVLLSWHCPASRVEGAWCTVHSELEKAWHMRRSLPKAMPRYLESQPGSPLC